MTERPGNDTSGTLYKPEFSDEISLADLVAVLLERKGIVLGCLAGVLIVAGILVYLTKPVYESRAVLLLGEPFAQETPQLLVLRLTENYKHDMLPALHDASIPKQVLNSIELTARGHTPEEAKHFLDSVVGEVISERKRLFDLNQAEQQKRLEALQAMREQIEHNASTYQQGISAALKKDPVLSTLLLMQRISSSKILLDIQDEESKLVLQMSDLGSNTSKILSPPSQPQSPVKPNIKAYLIIAAILGLLLGVFLAFMIDSFSKQGKKIDYGVS